ncbi:MAG: hypothetical protein GWN00_12970, partial [Aliifodinibius sp.]|nr:hypothetical protein [Fodinibius sp.]NIV12039.1 hypothetical protein [Fodinibius sp.]NIY25684.1 hypothetical protein [Fodinibius sp.]
VLEKEISDQLDNLLPDPNKAHAMRIEQEVIERAILYPVVMTKNYVVFPSALRDLKIFGAEEIEFYRAWKPL